MHSKICGQFELALTATFNLPHLCSRLSILVPDSEVTPVCVTTLEDVSQRSTGDHLNLHLEWER